MMYASLRRLDREDEEQLVNLAEHYAEVLRHELSESQEEHEDAGWGDSEEDAEHAISLEDEQHDEEGPWSAGPNSVRLVVASVDGDEVVVNIEIAESNPINGWGMQINYDKDELDFTQFIPGGFIGGTFIPIHTENESGVQVGGAQFGNQGMSEGDGVLGSIKLQIIGSLPTWISASDLQLKGDLENEINLASDQVEIDR